MRTTCDSGLSELQVFSTELSYPLLLLLFLGFFLDRQSVLHFPSALHFLIDVTFLILVSLYGRLILES